MRELDFIREAYHEIRFKFFQFAPEYILRQQFKSRMGYALNLKTPKTFNEKLQWLKLYWRDERATELADKYLVRSYVKKKGLEHLLNEIYGIYDHPNDINVDKMPENFVIKPNNGSGKVIFCKNKNNFDLDAAKKTLSKWITQNYYRTSLEWVYNAIPPKIIIEKTIKTPDGKPPKDYKFFCFSGEPKCLFVASDRGDHTTKFDFFDLKWNKWPVKNHYPNSQNEIPCPKKFNEMIEYAKILSDDFPHVRIDFYYEYGKIIFGECTFFHFSGQEPFDPIDYDYKLGSYLNVPF